MIKELEKKIVEASLKYYKGENSLMTDAQFDDALEELRKLDPDNFILKTTGWGANDTDSKINHIGEHPVGSLIKVKHPNTHQILTAGGLLTPKLDGLSIITNVYDGKITALTRNDGIVGKDCTDKIVYLLKKKHPEFYQSLLNIKGLFSFRGEVVTDPSCHAMLKATVGISLRNIAAGIVNRNEVTPDLDNLLYVPYFIRIDSQNTYSNNKQMIDKLEEMGSFPIPHEEFDITNPTYLEAIYKDWQVGFLIDGVVISTYKMWNSGPDYTSNEGNSIAYKFESESKEAIVDRVIWDTGSAGRVTPVAVLTAPIELAGAMVQNISLHHAQNVVDSGIGHGAVVRITRANEVIPYLQEVLSPVDGVVPSTCPVCGTSTVWDGCYLSCPSLECPAQSRPLIYKFFEFCSQPEGLSITTLNKYLDEFPVNGSYANVQSILDFILLFKQVPNKDSAARGNLLQQKFNNHYGDLLYRFENNIQAKLDKGLTYEEFWYILNLKGLGHSGARRLSETSPLALELHEIDSTLGNITVVSSLTNMFSSWKSLAKLFKIIESVKEVKASNKYSDVVFCMSGVRHKDLTKNLLDNSAKEVGGITGECNLLIVKDINSTSSKTTLAKSRGIKIISLEEALKVYG